MTTYYIKRPKKNIRHQVRLFALCTAFTGLVVASYIFFPLLSWKAYFVPVFAAQDIASPIPKTTITDTTLKSLVLEASHVFSGTDYTNAENWFPTYNVNKNGTKTLDASSYNVSIPKLAITNSVVSTVDYDLAKHLVHFSGTAFPPTNGNAVIFGHSTLPQLFNEKDYKTIFANAYKLGVGDDIIVHIGSVSYAYKVFSITVVDPTDTSIFSQDTTDAYLTLVTCTPPGTTWKRLIIKARLVPIKSVG